MASPNPEGNEKQKLTREEHSSPDNEKRARPTTGLYNNPRQPTYITPDSEEHRAAEKRHWQRQVRWQAVGAIATILAFGAAAVYACFAHQQVAAMQETLNQTKRVADSAVTQAAAVPTQIRDLEEANKNARELAAQANQIARDTLAMSERPWVGIGKVDVLNKPTVSQPIKVRAFVINGGKSPAVRVAITGFVEGWMASSKNLTIPFNNDQSFASACIKPEQSWEDRTDGGILLPGVTDYNFEKSSPAFPSPFVDLLINPTHSVHPTFDQWVTIKRESALAFDQPWVFDLYIAGCINYFDESKKPHRTNFCFSYGPSDTIPNGVFNSCPIPKGNSAD